MLRNRNVARITLLLLLSAAAVAPAPALAGSGRSNAPPTNSTDTPVPDVDYQYQQLYDMSTNYLQRYSGQDGPPGDLNPSDGNLPPNVNGWQEFFAHWKQQVTSPQVMGKFASDLHVDDHPFRAPSASFFGPPPPYDSDVASVTIPGASCPGQTVLIAGHPDSTPGTNIANGSAYDDTSGVTMGMAELQAMTRWWTEHGTWPARTFRIALFDAEEEGLYGSQYYASSLIPPGPQGQIVLVANMDQNGMEYPAHPAGSTQTTFGPGFWYTNINASPIHDFRIYTKDGASGPAPAPFVANMPAIQHFRSALSTSVAAAFAALGRKYHFSIPLENQQLEGGRSIPAYLPADIAKFSPVQDDTLGRTDQVPFLALGIPGYGLVGAYDSNAQDNPLAAPATPLSPLGALGIPVLAGYDTPRDNIVHLNLMTSGTTGGDGGVTGSVELRRALELPMTWTLNLISRPEYVGDVTHPSAPVAWFEALPTPAAPGASVRFNGADTAANGNSGLKYVWDFGDGTVGSGAVAAHSYRTAGWYTTKLVVTDAAGHVSGYQSVVQVGHPTASKPSADPCGTVPTSSALVLLARAGLHPANAAAPARVRGKTIGRLARTGSSARLPLAGLALLVVGAAGWQVRRRRAT